MVCEILNVRNAVSWKNNGILGVKVIYKIDILITYEKHNIWHNNCHTCRVRYHNKL